MNSLRDAWATRREGLRAFLFLVGGGAALAGLLSLALPFAPASAQQKAIGALTWLPGLERGLSLSPERPEGRGTLSFEPTGRELADFPPPGGDWSGTDSVRIDGLGLALVTALWGAILGLTLLLLWRSSDSRRVLTFSLLLGVASGLSVAHSLESFPSRWAPFWLRGIGGLPGLEEKLGSVVPIPGAEASTATLSSSGGLVAEYPAALAPWPADAPLRITGRCRVWFAAYGSVFWLAALTWAAALRAKRERWRWPLFAFGLGLTCFLVLPFLPTRVGQAWSDLLARALPAVGLEEAGWLTLMERTRLGFDVGLGMLLVLVVGACIVLLPVGMIVAAGHAIVQRVGVRRERSAAGGEREDGEAGRRDSIPVTGVDPDPDWLADYEERRSAAPPEEPHPQDGAR